MSLVVTGTVGIDTIVTPKAHAEGVLGGSCAYFAAAASFFGAVRMVAAYCLPALVETYLELWQHLPTFAQRSALEPLLRRALQALRRVAAILRIAEPSSALLEGRYEWLHGRQRAARRCFKRSRQLADERGLPREAARATAWQGRATPGPVGQIRLRAALRRLTALGAEWEAAQARAWLAPSGPDSGASSERA